MTNKSKTISCILAAISGACFVTGIALLINEGSAVNYGVCKEININD